jgi:hypothetical protein
MLGALVILAAVLLALAWITRASWQQAPLQMPSRVTTADTSPQLRIELGRGRTPSLDAATVEIDDRVVEARLRIDRSVITLQLPSLAEGAHRLTVGVPGSALQSRDQSLRSTVVVDTTPPPLKIRTEQGTSTGQRAAVVVSVDTEDGSSVSIVEPVQRTIELVSGRGKASFELREGRHSLTVESHDAVGNVKRISRRIWVDTTPPTLDEPDFPAVSRTGSPRFVLPVRDNGPAQSLTVNARIDGRAVTAKLMDGAVHVRSRGPLSEGEHALRVVVTDGGGNASERTSSFVVDSTESLGAATIRAGARGDDIKLLQRELARPGAWTSEPPRLELSGIFDGATEAAVKRFQSEQGLGVDGVAGPFTIAALTLRITIDQSAHKLILFRYGEVFKTYRIAVGQPKYPTPNGVFRIVDKQKNPTWIPPDSEWAKDAKVTPPGPDNPLGTRWMGLDEPGIGIHGTNAPQSLGYSVSHGCIRMAMADVEELFELVAEGTQVEIRR